MKPPGKSAAEALAEGPVAGLLDQVRLLGRVTDAVATLTRELAVGGESLPPPRCAFRARVVILTVDSPSHAAKLRQRASQIEQFLRQRLPEVTGISIRLQPGGPTYSVSVMPSSEGPRDSRDLRGADPATTTDPQAALRFAEDLATHLRDSPLRQAALRLESSLRARLSGDRGR